MVTEGASSTSGEDVTTPQHEPSSGPPKPLDLCMNCGREIFFEEVCFEIAVRGLVYHEVQNVEIDAEAEVLAEEGGPMACAACAASIPLHVMPAPFRDVVEAMGRPPQR